MKLPDQIAKIPVGHVIQFISSVSAISLMIYSFGAPIVKSYAADAFVEMLRQNDVDPHVFKRLKDQSVETSKDVDVLKDKVDDLNDTLRIQGEAVGKVEGKLDRLIEILVNKRADFTPSPPGTGPSSPVNLKGEP